jgi:hypothetical protein
MRFLTVLMIFLLVAISASSQTSLGTYSIHGIVMDSNGAVVPNAKVLATWEGRSNEASKIFSGLTDPEGEFTIQVDRPGRFKLLINSIGMSAEKSIYVPLAEGLRIRLVIGEPCSDTPRRTGRLANGERAQMVRTAFAEAIPGTLVGQEDMKNPLIVSTQNIRHEWVPVSNGLELRFLTEAQIQRKADNQGDFMYVHIKFLKESPKCSALEVSYIWKVGKHSRMGYLSGGGRTYEFRKRSGKWEMKSIGGWIS